MLTPSVSVLSGQSGPRSRVSGLAFVTVLGLGLFSPDSAAQEVPDLSGAWILNFELSDEPRRRAPNDVGERQPSRSRGGFAGFGGGGFGTGGGGWSARDRRAGASSVEDIDRLRRAVGDQLTAPRRLTIEQDDREILFTYGDGRYMRIVPDGKAHAGIAGHSQVTRKVRWQGPMLLVEVTLETDQRVFHHLELRSGGNQLVMVTILEPRGAQDEVRLRRIYDRHLER